MRADVPGNTVRTPRPLLAGAVVLYFLIALEVLVMISPFAAFFYAVFNPVLLFLAGSPATRWLADFFLPHLVLPPGALLRTIRVAGSVLLVAGAGAFLACAGQVYSAKLARRGPVLGGLYRWIRHPQYLSLAVAGAGLAVLWPRFLNVVLWTVMLGFYVLLARDEERRMLSAHGERYGAYRSRTGMFLPRRVEALARRVSWPRAPAARFATGLVATLGVAVGGAFALRAYTVSQLPLWSDGRTAALAILPDDEAMLQHRMKDVLTLPGIQDHLPPTGALLVYAVPVQYVMQGMIADTDPAYRLYEHHQTLPMIVDWILHPFGHLQGHAAMHHGAGGAPGFATRRLIFLEIPTAGPEHEMERASLFAVGAVREPRFFADVDLHALRVLRVQELGPGTGWGRVPTPAF